MVSVLWLGPEWVGRSGQRGLAKSVERFSLRDLPGSFGFPIFRNRVPMGVGRSGLDREMQDFKGFHFVYSKHFFVNDSAYQNRAGRWLTANRPSRRSRISEFAPGPARFSCTSRAGARRRGGTVGQGWSRPTGGFRPPTGSVAYADHGCKFGRPTCKSNAN